MTLPVKTSVSFYAKLLDSISSAKDLRALRQAHAVILAVGFAHPDFLRSKLSACYARCAAIDDAFLVFSRANRRPTFLYNSLIRSYASLRLFSPALSLYRCLLFAGSLPDHHTFAAILRSCAGLCSLRLGRGAHAAAVVSGQAADAVVSNSLLSMYSRCGDMVSARKVFDRMSKRNLVSWTSMISACGANQYAEEAVRLFEEMLEAGVTPDGKAMAVVLAACSHGGMVETGWRVFGMLDGRFGVRPGVEHYTCMVGILGRAGRVEEAEELLAEMEAEPDEALWRTLAVACRMHGRMDVAERVAQRMDMRCEEWDQQLNGESISTVDTQRL